MFGLLSRTVKPFNLATVPGEGIRMARLYNDYFNFDIDRARQQLTSIKAAEWEQLGQNQAVEIFHAAAKRVPAYKDFLQRHGIDPEKIKTFADFVAVPPTDKDSYIRAYSVDQLCWDGDFYANDIISVSSGSTGKPFLWPREAYLEIETTYFFELIVDSFFQVSKRRTLIVDCFAMGMYVGGPFFLNAMLRIAQKNHAVTVVTPGNVMDDIIRVVRELVPHYEQVVLSGYPPFLKDVIKQGAREGIDWSQIRTILFPAGEGFSEGWRQDVVADAQVRDYRTDFLGYYGTADAAVLGVETPWSIVVREAVSRDHGAIEQIFGQSRLPSLMQYIPTARFFECLNGELHFTTANGCIPLIRYNIHDNGGLLSHHDVLQIASNLNLDVSQAVSNISWANRVWELPYVYVFGRSDHTAVLYGANIYPENIKTALELDRFPQHCSGRFVMQIEEDKGHNNFLALDIECTEGHEPSEELRVRLRDAIVRTLKEVNSEYNNAAKAIGEKAIPVIRLHHYGDEKYFPRMKKQRWKA